MKLEENWGSELTNAESTPGNGMNRGCKIQIFIGGKWFRHTSVYSRALHNTVTYI